MALLGIFVGGRSRRMGARPKGRLLTPGGDRPLLDALVEAGRAAELECVLVGDASPYEDLARGVPRLADDPAGRGPLGGLRALLMHAGATPALTVACDMPHVGVEALLELRDAASRAAIVSPRRAEDAPWEPLFSRYDAPRVLPAIDQALASDRRSLQKLFRRLEVEELPLTAAVLQALGDWDTPDDVRAETELRIWGEA
ncbi:MAG: molybdenum cofactor guanylyltransferase [Deltaproteobacteria bacterium]|nr:molybdenum cofactor guanylyltransferase [Deltaproteobacteria bacterium]